MPCHWCGTECWKLWTNRTCCTLHTSLNLAPCDYHLFRPIKQMPGGQEFFIGSWSAVGCSSVAQRAAIVVICSWHDETRWQMGVMGQIFQCTWWIKNKKNSKNKHYYKYLKVKINVCSNGSLPARRYASAGYRDRNVSVCPSVCASVCHAPVLCQNEEC